jgi:hypothetical protein
VLASATPLREERIAGSEHPFLIEAVDPGGRWVILCQAREDTNGDGKVSVSVGTHGHLGDDRVEQYLVKHAGLGERIDEYVAHDPTGRYVAFLRRGRLVVVDVQAGTEAVLRADVRDDGDPFKDHRVAVFDPLGTTIAYMREARSTGHATVVVRDLLTGSETDVDPGPGLLWRVAVAAGGRSITAQVVATDSDKNGALEWPGLNTSLSARRCRGPANYTVGSRKNDALETRIVSLATGKVTVVPKLVGPLGDAWLVAEPSTEGDAGARERLLLVSDDGAATELASARCDAEPYYVDHERKLVLVTCQAEKVTIDSVSTRTPVELCGTGPCERLFWSTPAWPRRKVGTQRFVLFPSTSDRPSKEGQGALVDLDRRTVVRVEAGIAIAVDGSKLLLRDGDNYLVRDLLSGERQLLGHWSNPTRDDTLAQGRYVLHEQMLVDLAEGRLAGTLAARPFAVATDGSVLHLREGAPPPRSTEIWSGPPRWSRAVTE